MTEVEKEVKILFHAALLIFSITVVVGMLNGLDLVEFDRSGLVTHVHAGTLGWITLGVFAACLWIFSEGGALTGWRRLSSRWLSWGSVIAIAVQVAAFYSGDFNFRLMGGILTMLAILGFLIWVVAQSRQAPLTVAQLGMLGAMITLTLGAVVGVLMGIFLTGRLTSLPEQIFITHPASLVIGFLILAGMSITEWRLMPEQTPISASRLGIAQMALPFLGGLSLTIGALLDNFGLIALNVPLEVAGVVIFLIRLGRNLIRVPWSKGSQERLYAVSVLFLIANVTLLATLIVGVVTGKYEDFALIPLWLIFAMDHAMFIGVMTNGLMGLVYEASADQRSLLPWADHVIFWAMNVGLVGFVIGLMLDKAVIKQIFSPIMGVGILIAIVIFNLRLRM
jgi:predicted membrane protein